MAIETSDQGDLCNSCGKPLEQCQCATVRVSLEEALAMQRPHSLNAGDIEGRYRIIEKIGVGGMGTVYRAEHVVLHKQLAVKVLRTELLDDSNAMARFEQESRACAALSHPNLVAVFDCGITQIGQPYLVMEFLSGKSLLEIVKEEGALPLAKFFSVFIETADGLAYAHDNGVIHRDLKPSNILVNPDPRGGEITKIVDFGVAKIEDLGGEFQMLTRTGEVFGSPAYMSPEQCKGNQVDQRSDIYALGCVMYEALSGKQAFKGANIITIMNKQMESYPPPPERISGEAIPLDLRNIVMKCLQKNPDDRYQAMIDLRKDLERALEQATFNRPIKVGSARLPSATLPILVSLAVLASILSFPALMPGGSLKGLTTTMKAAPTTSKSMLAAFSQRKHMSDYSSEILLSLLNGPESKELSLVDRSAIAVMLFDHIYHREGQRQVLELFGKPVSELLDQIEGAAKKDPQSVAAASWSAPLLYYYAGGAQEHERHYKDAQSKYRQGIARANLLDSPKWVKAKLQQELGELYMVLPKPQPQNAIAPLKESRRLLLLERKTIRNGRLESLTDSTNLLFDALTQLNKPDEAAALIESFIVYEQAQQQVNKETVRTSMKKLIELYTKSKNQQKVKYWVNERVKLESKQTTASSTSSSITTPYTVQLVRALNARSDQFAIPEIILRFNNALTTAEEKKALDVDRVAIGAAALDVCSEYWLYTEGEQMYKRIEPALYRLREGMAMVKPGQFFNTGHAALALHNLAQAEYRKNEFDKARTHVEMAKPYCQGQPDGEWMAGRLDVLEAKILAAQNKDLEEADRSTISGINRLAATRLAGNSSKENFRLADAYWARGTVLKKRKQFQKAKDAINKAISIVKNSPGNEWHVAAEYQPELSEIEKEEKLSHK